MFVINLVYVPFLICVLHTYIFLLLFIKKLFNVGLELMDRFFASMYVFTFMDSQKVLTALERNIYFLNNNFVYKNVYIVVLFISTANMCCLLMKKDISFLVDFQLIRQILEK